MVKASAKQKGKRGTKSCQKCGKKIASRSMTCKYCDAEQTPKNKSTGSKRDGFALVRSVAAFVRDRGGIDEAKAQLDAVETLLKETGGINEAKAAFSEAKAALAQLEAIKGL